ncbi:alpha/beta fold hydrolase [Acetobacterium bakii]|uniref:alpha/beta fold hydrolase n=1 Tax=Acetobacterium bakii TaxID=52689 RepID=UPI0006828244|nr:alpha/beta hydrolase [Acetobacterium bakii]
MENRITGSVITEGDTLYFKITGTGEPFVYIAGGGGDGDLFLPLADKISNKYKVITYDRRANGRSTMNFPDEFDIAQQARDVVAVLNACGETSAYFFGNSSGAVIALELVATFPEVVKTAIIHEAPLARLAPETEKWQAFFQSCYARSKKLGGSSMAAVKFMFGIEIPPFDMIKAELKARKYLKNEPKQPHEIRIPSKQATDYLIKHELLPVTNYQPQLEKLKENKTKIVIAIGTYAIEHHTWLSKIGERLQSQIGCKLAVFPGHHASFMSELEAWSVAIIKVI